MQPKAPNRVLFNMQKWLKMVLIFLPLGLLGQGMNPVSVIRNEPVCADRIYACKGRFNDAASLMKSLLRQLPQLSNSPASLKLQYEKSSMLGRHYSFVQTVDGTPVYGAYIKVNLNHEGEVIHIAENLPDVKDIPVQRYVAETKPAFLVNTGKELIPVFRDGNKLLNASGSELMTYENRYYFQNDDTLVGGKVFKMDPLTSAGVIYGQNGTYKHFNDSDYALINDQRTLVHFPATYTSGKFQLNSAFAKIEDFAIPTVAPAEVASPIFDFTRKQSGFKDVMAYYYVLQTRNYFMELGFTNRMQYTQRIDAHSGTGDQSFFSLDDSTLNFGTGGVPDAEDADVICHEYTHAMSFDISPTPDMFPERRSIEEGICDVTSAIFSKRTSLFNWRYLYNFDGPNPIASGSTGFWGGRNGESSKTYLDKIGNPYKDCEIWTSCMLDIGEHIGQDTLMILILNSVAMMTQATTMPQAAQLMLDADSILYNGRHQLTMGWYFNLRKFGTFPQGFSSLTHLPPGIAISNTLDFALGQQDAFIHNITGHPVLGRIFDINGKCLVEWVIETGETRLQPGSFQPGLYLFECSVEGQKFVQKLIRN